MLLNVLGMCFSFFSAHADSSPTGSDYTGQRPASQSSNYVTGAWTSAKGSGWWFSPLDIKSNENDEDAWLKVDSGDWSRVPTKERYDLKPIGFYGAEAVLSTKHFSLNLNYERGGGFDASMSVSSLLVLGLQLRGFEYLDRISFESNILDFRSGQALLLMRESEAIVDEAVFELILRQFSVGYQLEKVKVVGEYFHYNLPRNIYLRQEGDVNAFLPISDELMKIDTKIAFVGAALDNREVEFENGLLKPFDPDQEVVFGGSLLVGYGPYEIASIESDEVLDTGQMYGVGLKGNLVLRKRFWKHVTIGTSLDLSFYYFQPIGLPDDIQERAEASDLDTDELSVNFGTVDALARVYGFIRVGI